MSLSVSSPTSSNDDAGNFAARGAFSATIPAAVIREAGRVATRNQAESRNARSVHESILASFTDTATRLAEYVRLGIGKP
jgi:hypothetical protein